MTHETDFLDLYRRLGLHPGCSLDELKHAYRRHVSALHPDRRQGHPTDARAEARLQRLTAQYGAAMEFHRRHGRLPGAPSKVAAGTHAPAIERHEAEDPFVGRSSAPFPPHPQRDAPPPVRLRSRTKLFLLLAVVALATFGWMMRGGSPSVTGDTDDDEAGLPETASAPAEPVAAGPTLRVGMSTDEVRELEGEPVAMHGELWEYGPSWIRFDHGDVVEWHSSPLRPLHADVGVTAVRSR